MGLHCLTGVGGGKQFRKWSSLTEPLLLFYFQDILARGERSAEQVKEKARTEMPV